MTTHRSGIRVSLAVFTATLLLGACATAPSRLATIGLAPLSHPPIAVGGDDGAAEAPAATIRFDNQAQEFVRVYLVGDKQQWLLGRVERGATTTLKLPKGIVDGTTRWVRLSVVSDARTAARPGDAPVTMGVEPLELILSQRWTFSQSLAGGQLTSLPLEHSRADPD